MPATLPPSDPSSARRPAAAVGAELTEPNAPALGAAAPERLDLGGRGLRAHTARGTIVNATFLVALSALGVLKGFAVAAFLSREQFGVWGIVMVLLATVLAVKHLGVGDRFIQQSERDQELAFQRAFTVEVLFTCAFTAAMVAAVPLMALAYDEPRLIWPGIALAAVVPATMLQAPIWIFYRRMNFVRQRLLQAIDPLVAFAATLGLAIAGAGVWSLVVGLVAGAWTAALVALVASPYPLRLHYEREALRSYWSFSWPLFVVSGTGLLMAHVTMFFGELTLGVAGVGAITLAVTVARFADRVDEILTGTLYPAICAVRDQTDVLLETFEKSNRLALMWGVPFGIGLALFAADLIDFALGERWRPALIMLQAFGVTAAAGQVAFNWGAYFRARGETRALATAQAFTVIAFLVVTLPLLIAFGLPGIAAGTVVVTGVTLVVRARYVRRLFPTFRLLPHAARAAAPVVPGVVAVLAVRAATGADHTGLQALVELALFVAIVTLTTAWAQWPLLREVGRYLRTSTSTRSPAAALSD